MLLGCKKPNNTDCIELFEISKTKLTNTSIVLNTDELIANYGEPNQIIKDCVFYPTGFDKNKIAYDCWFYDNPSIGFEKHENLTYLSSIEFEEGYIELYNPKIILSSNTKLQHVKKIFPIAYANRRIDSKTFSYKYDWISINTESDLNEKILANTVELVFENDKLKYFEFRWKPKNKSKVN